MKKYNQHSTSTVSANSPSSPRPIDPLLTSLLFSSVQVNIPSTAGDLGILADHVPTIQQLRPGLVEIIESSGKSSQFFVSGGFATVSEGSQIAVNVVEAFAPEDFSAEV